MDRDKAYIGHIKDALAEAERFTDGMTFEVFIADSKTKYAVERCLEIVGEATKNVSRETRDIHKDIPWKSIAGLRDKITHHYFDVDYSTLWDVIKYDVPILRQALKDC